MAAESGGVILKYRGMVSLKARLLSIYDILNCLPVVFVENLDFDALSVLLFNEFGVFCAEFGCKICSYSV